MNIKQTLKQNSKYLLFMLLASQSFALPSDQQRPLFVNSEHWEYNYNKGVSVNTGNVVIDRGTSHLTAEKVYTYRDKNDEITKLIAHGKPAHYSTVLNFNTPRLYTEGNTITYYPQKQLMILQGDALAHRGPNSVAAPKITYYINEQRMLTDAPAPQTSHIVVVNQQRSPTKGSS